MTEKIEFKNLGLIDYNEALLFQESLVEKRFKNEISDTILFCSHPPVVTLGRSSQKEDLVGWDGALVEVSRGGRATYHGPGQKIIYPILDLRREDRVHLRPKDVMSYLTTFENAVLKTLKEVGLKEVTLKEDVTWDAQGKKLLNRGIWLDGKKIAAFGIAIRRWITFHGCAINVLKDEKSFQGINPCGYQQNAVGYLQDFINTKDIDLDLVLTKHLTESFKWTT